MKFKEILKNIREKHADSPELVGLIEAAYREGYTDAVSNYAVWHNGMQIVGSGNHTLASVLKELETSPIPVRY